MKPSVLIVAAKWWSLSARLAADLAHRGCRVSALCPRRHPLSFVAGLERIEPYAGVKSELCLARTIAAVGPDLIVPCDDGVVAQLHALHAKDAALRPLIEASVGDPASFPVARSRRRLLAMAAELGIDVPETRAVRSTGDLTFWHENIAPSGVLKVDGESGGNGVRICLSLQDALAGWRELAAPQRLVTGLKRLMIDRDPLAVWLCNNRAGREITMQRLVDGRPANTMAACKDGELLAEISVVVLAADGPTGAATIVRRVRDERMTRAAARLARHLKLSGFFGLDFMIDNDTGVPYLIEMNPRCTQLGHLEFLDQVSLAAALGARWQGCPVPPLGNPLLLDTVALFPQALRTLDEGNRHLSGAYLDVPRDQPALMAELKLEPWPQRRWAARLYHLARPIERIAAVEYELAAQPSPHRQGFGIRTGT